jgi:RsiW-degrading membrane proteinase PrsW (M82 family)
MGDGFFYAEGAERRGPVDLATLQRLLAEGKIARETPVFREGVETPMPAHAVAAFVGAAPPQTPRPGLLRSIGIRLSALAGVPQADDVPVRAVLMGDGDAGAARTPAEDVFAAGTSTTTPPLVDVPAGWPRPRVFWRVLIGALLTYVLLRLGLTEFDNPRFRPGLIVVGAFGVPLSVVVFFYEMNTPRNVSVYQVAKMVAFGGAAGLLATVFLGRVVPGTGVGALWPALLTGAVEETGKTLALLIVVGSLRFRWQLNGLLFGAAVGAGFAGFESASYADESRSVFTNIMWRAILAPGGHVIWTAMIAAAIWQVRGTQRFRFEMLLHGTVVRRWFVAVALHGVWDALLFPSWEILVDVVLLLVGWYLLFGIFKLAIAEVAAAKAAAAAAPPAPPPAQT